MQWQWQHYHLMDTIFPTTQRLVLYSRQQTRPHGPPVPYSRSLLNLIFRWFPATKCSLALAALFLCWELNLSRLFQLINPWVTAAAWMTDQGSAQGWTCHEGEMELKLKAWERCLDSVARQHFLFSHFLFGGEGESEISGCEKKKGPGYNPQTMCVRKERMTSIAQHWGEWPDPE